MTNPNNFPGPQIASDNGPSLAVLNGVLFAAWKGGSGDQRIWWSSFDSTTSTWVGQEPMPSPIGTSVAPALAAFNDGSGEKLFAAWKGTGNDQSIYWSRFDGKIWQTGSGLVQEPMPVGIATGIGPSLAEFNGLLYAAWRGPVYDIETALDGGGPGDENLYYSSFDGNFWGTAQGPSSLPMSPSPNSIYGRSWGPSLAACTLPNQRPKLFAAWKGSDLDVSGSDLQIWYAVGDT